MPLRMADISSTERFEDGAAWLVLRTHLTKGDEDTIRDQNSRYRLSADAFAGEAGPGAAVEIVANQKDINRTLFDVLAVEWSIGDGKPTATDYDALDVESGRWVDDCIVKATAIGRRRVEGNGRSTGKRRSSRTTSPAGKRSKSPTSPTPSDD